MDRYHLPIPLGVAEGLRRDRITLMVADAAAMAPRLNCHNSNPTSHNTF